MRKFFDVLGGKIYAFSMQNTGLCKFLLSIFAKFYFSKNQLNIYFGSLTKFSMHVIHFYMQSEVELCLQFIHFAD